MEDNIIIQQAYYGEVNRAHSCINTTISDSELNSFLIAFTDRPAAVPIGEVLKPYLSGVRYSTYYIFTKTFPDPFASRAGMVFTHALILNLLDIKSINNIDNVLSMLIDDVPTKRTDLSSINPRAFDAAPVLYDKYQPLYIQKAIFAFMNGEVPVLYSGEIESFKIILQLILNYPDVSLRNKLKFRTSFTPSDIEGLDDLTIVSIQREFLQKWPGKNIIKSEDKEIVEISSSLELLFLGHKEGNPFHSFLLELNVGQNELHNIGKAYELFNDYLALDNTEDADNLRKNIRTLSIISPSENDGKLIKNKFIDKLDDLVSSNIESNLKALRNIEWGAFHNGEKRARRILSGFVNNELIKKTNSQIESLSETLNVSFNGDVKSWWHDAIQLSFKTTLTENAKFTFKNIWRLLDFSEETFNNVFLIVLANKRNESNLRENLPENIKKENIEALEKISIKRKWYLLHADVLLKRLQMDKAIVEQLELEKNLDFNASIGVRYLAGKLDDLDVISLTIQNCDTKLVQISSERILINKLLLESIDLTIHCWVAIWSLSLMETRDISYGLEGKEQKVVDSILDIIVAEIKLPEIIIELLASSVFNDIYSYEMRDKCWDKFPPKFKDLFLKSTSKTTLNKLLLDEIDISAIEKPLLDTISSDSYMTNFLSENKDDIEPVIKIFEIFTNLKDKFLSDYINFYKLPVSDSLSIRLGQIVIENEFTESARTIYDKSQNNNSFVLALEKCQSIVSLHWWESIFGSNINVFTQRPQLNVEPKENYMKKSLPVIVILTAIQEEYMAVRNHLKEITEVDKNDTSYEAGTFELNGKDIANVVIRECGAKNTTASQESERAIQYFKPKCMLFVGIAGSRKPKDFTVGDVIFPEKVLSYEGGKSEKNSFKSRPDFAEISYTLREIAKKERRKEDWKILIKNEWNQDVKADLGIIASGEKLVEHYDSDIGKILTKYFNDTSAVEMEGFGFAKSATSQGRETNDILVGIVRGISDVIEQPESDSGESNDRRPDNVKKFASDTAAAFAFWLIFKAYQNT